MDALVLCAELQIRKTFSEDLAFQNAAADQFYLSLFNRPLATLETAQMGDQLIEVGVGDPGRRHSASRQAIANKRDQLLIVARTQSRPDGWSHFASVSVRAMTAR